VTFVPDPAGPAGAADDDPIDRPLSAITGSGGTGSPPAGAPGYAAERVTILLLGGLRALTLLLAGLELPGAAPRSQPTASLLLAALTCVSALTFARAIIHVTGQRSGWPFDAVTVCAETVAAAAALVVLAHLTPAADRAGSAFWAEPYTVISAVIIGAAEAPLWAGPLAAACLSGIYLLSVLTAIAGPAARGQASAATAWTNAASYLAFYVLAALGVRLLRSIISQSETLRQMIASLSDERTRITAANRIWLIGHNHPKALLRQVWQPVLPPDKLRILADKCRASLLRELVADPRAPVALSDELARIAATFTEWMPLEVDLSAMSGQPPGIPAMLMAEAARELLNNAAHHRYGYPARLTGIASAQHAGIRVHNEGPGVDPAHLLSEWARKQGTIHQFEAAGGSCQVHSSPRSAGTTVVLHYPGTACKGQNCPLAAEDG
jgi:hypothetical protein